MGIEAAYLVMALMNMTPLERAVAYLVEKLSMMMKMGTKRMPPPMPPLTERADIRNIKRKAKNSYNSIGKMALCLHWPD